MNLTQNRFFEKGIYREFGKNRVKLYDGGGAQYGENCISQKQALQRKMQLPA